MILNNKRPVLQFDLDGNFIKEFESIKSAAKQFGGKISDRSKIFDSIRINAPRKNKIAHGFIWKYKEK